MHYSLTADKPGLPVQARMGSQNMFTPVTNSATRIGSDLSVGFSRVLVTTDFSATSRTAFNAALDLARLFHARLLALHVFEYGNESISAEGAPLGEMDTRLRDAKSWLKSMQREATQAGLQCETALRTGLPVATILEFIAAEHIDLTIMGTSALHGFERLLFGSTAEAVLRKSPTPVLTVGPRADAARVSQLERPVVFATDFHTTTVDAIRLAAAVSQVTDSQLHCLHVLPRALEGSAQAAVIPAILSEALQHIAMQSGIAQDNLNDHPEDSQHRRPPCNPICATTFGSEVSSAVVDYAKQHNAKLIVLGIRQASLATTHTPAHIAFRIITEATCPVLTMAFENKSHYFTSLAAACI